MQNAVYFLNARYKITVGIRVGTTLGSMPSAQPEKTFV